MTKEYNVVADIIYSANYMVEADSELEAKRIVEKEQHGIEPIALSKETSPIVTHIRECL